MVKPKFLEMSEREQNPRGLESEHLFSIDQKEFQPRFPKEDELSQIYPDSNYNKVGKDSKEEKSIKRIASEKKKQNLEEEESYYWESDKDEILVDQHN